MRSAGLILLGILFIRFQFVNNKFMYQRVYDSLPTSVFERVGVLRELLCVRYGYCSQTLLIVYEMDFIVQFLCLQYCIYFIFLHFIIVYLCTTFILNKRMYSLSRMRMNEQRRSCSIAASTLPNLPAFEVVLLRRRTPDCGGRVDEGR